MVGVVQTPTVPQTLCTSAFQPIDGMRVGLFAINLNKEIKKPRIERGFI